MSDPSDGLVDEDGAALQQTGRLGNCLTGWSNGGAVNVEENADKQGSSTGVLEQAEINFLNNQLRPHLTLDIKPDDQGALWKICKDLSRKIPAILAAIGNDPDLREYVSLIARLPAGCPVKKLLTEKRHFMTTMRILREEHLPLTNDQWCAWGEWMEKNQQPKKNKGLLGQSEDGFRNLKEAHKLILADRKVNDSADARRVADPSQMKALAPSVGAIIKNDADIQHVHQDAFLFTLNLIVLTFSSTYFS